MRSDDEKVCSVHLDVLILVSDQKFFLKTKKMNLCLVDQETTTVVPHSERASRRPEICGDPAGLCLRNNSRHGASSRNRLYYLT